ncbi:MAG: polysaccharide biosynthesis tyrosine autokinase [Bacteroidota bacterium]
MDDKKPETIVISDDSIQKSIDIKVEFLRIISYWKLFLICIVIALAATFLYNRYTKPVYKANCRILIKDDSKSKVSESPSIISELDIFNTQKNLINEIGILKSKKLARKTVLDLNLYITYYVKSKQLGRIIEIYEDCPFLVKIDTLHPQILNVPVDITPLSNSKYILQIDKQPETVSCDFTKKTDNWIPVEMDMNYIDTLQLYDTFCNKDFSFRLLPNEKTTAAFEVDRSYSFEISNPLTVGKAYADALQVAAIEKDASILEVSINSNKYHKAIEYLNKLCENYIDLDLELKNNTATKTIEFINDQMIEITDSLSNVEDILENFRTNNKVIDLTEESTLVFKKLEEQDKEKSLANIEYKYYEYLTEFITANNDFTDVVVPSSIGLTNVTMNSLISNLITLSQEKIKLEIGLTENSPVTIALEKNISATKKSLLENVESSLSLIKIKQKNINQQISETEAAIYKLPGKERELLSIQRKFNVNDEIYNFLLQKKAEASISKASSISDNQMVDTAELVECIHPKKMLNYIIAFFISVFLPFIYLILKDYFNDKIRDKNDVEANSGLPFLGTLAHSKYDSQLIVANYPKSMVSETLRAIKANIDFIATKNNSNVIVITSTVSGEGKTFCSMNLASAYAISDKKTLLIGADLRKPKIYSEFDLKNEKGLTDYLIGKTSLDTIIQATQFENLFIMIAGTVPPNPAELLSSKHFTDLLNSLKEKFDYIIIDTPPIGLVTDAIFLMKQADATIYILKHNITRRRVLQELDEIIKNTGIKNIALILNDLDFKKSKYGPAYSYGYGYGYGYASKNGNNYYED